MKHCLLRILTVLTAHASACEVPVFRFALERWPADPLQVKIYADGSSTADAESAIQWLRNQVPNENAANLHVSFENPIDPGDGKITMRLFPSHQETGDPNIRPLWDGPLTEDNARKLSDSPLRQQIAKQLLDGTSAVWLVISQGDPDADAKAMEAVQRGMHRAMQQLSLPKGVIHPEEAAEKFSQNPQATMDDVLRTKIPLRIRFEAILLRHDNQDEQIFREILQSIAPASTKPGEPLVTPIFGRGRALAPAPASVLDENAVFDGCSYLCGACACMVKQQNPGVDLPFRTNWDAHIKPFLASIDHNITVAAPEVVQYGKAIEEPAKKSSWPMIVLFSIPVIVLFAWLLRKKSAEV